MTQVNVALFAPRNVPSMLDEIADGSVAKAKTAFLDAYRGDDSDGIVQVIDYDGDFDDALAAIAEYTKTTPGADLVGVITDGVADDEAKAERALRELNDDMVVAVLVSNQPVENREWLNKLDNDAAGPNNFDVLDTSELSTAKAREEVDPFLERVAKANAGV